MKKRGQFYLIATLVLVGLVASMVTVYNLARPTTEDPTVYDLSNEISYEGAQIVNSGTFNAQSQAQINANLENLTDYYASSNPASDLFLLYGDENQISFLLYNNTDMGSIGASLGGGMPLTVSYLERTEKRKGTLTATNGQVQVNLKGGTYNFTLNQGQNFFIILTKDRGSEKFVSSPDSEDSGALSPP